MPSHYGKRKGPKLRLKREPDVPDAETVARIAERGVLERKTPRLAVPEEIKRPKTRR